MTLVIATLVISVFVMASGSFAAPGFNADCANTVGCHTTTDTTLSTNATGTIEATRGVSFLLIIDASHSLVDPGDIAISIQDGVADNEEFTISDDIVVDGDAEDANGNIGEIQASITFTPRTVGSFVIRIWSAATGGIGRTADIDVNVSERTVTGTTTTSTTTTTTPTGPTTLTPEELIAIWELMMYTITPAAAVILALLGYFVLRRTRN